MKKTLILLLTGGFFCSFIYFYCAVINDYVSEADYARMSQKLVEQSIAMDQCQCSGQNAE
ncbi:hypothetical protein [Pectinatus frisingensis]|uniref:hypothetical protein n=1 Tax=Pectinatus frisingensis TaxID=865 RepID=UPI0018C47E22|nr:hypothetical protein [Pectinatus frisingensis]